MSKIDADVTIGKQPYAEHSISAVCADRLAISTGEDLTRSGRRFCCTTCSQWFARMKELMGDGDL